MRYKVRIEFSASWTKEYTKVYEANSEEEAEEMAMLEYSVGWDDQAQWDADWDWQNDCFDYGSLVWEAEETEEEADGELYEFDQSIATETEEIEDEETEDEVDGEVPDTSKIVACIVEGTKSGVKEV